MQTQISFFDNVTSTLSSSTVTLNEVYEIIVSDVLKDHTHRLRLLKENGNQSEFDRLKKALPAVTFSGLFEGGRTVSHLKKYSEFICLDFDKIPTVAELEEAKKTIKAMPLTKLVFTSPSGKGLKVVVEVSCKPEDHKSVYKQVYKYYEAELNLPADSVTSDLSRLCLLVKDSDAFFNEYNEAFEYQEEKALTANKPKVDCGSTQDFDALVEYTNRIVKFEQGSRNTFVLTLANNCNRRGLCKDFVSKMVIEKYVETDFEENEIIRTIGNAYKNTSQHNTWKRPKSETKVIAVHEPNLHSTPFFENKVVENMPPLIRDVAEMFQENRTRDMFLLSFITIVSGCLDSVRGWYRDDLLYPNLFSFITGLSAWSKSVMSKAREIFKWVDMLAPLDNSLLMTLNGTFKAHTVRLKASNGLGALCDEEVQALSKLSKHDRDGMDYLLKQGYDNKQVTDGRSSRNEEVVVEIPKFSFLTAGNLGQVSKVVSNIDDGSFSRYLYYGAKEVLSFHAMETEGWKDFCDQKDEYAESLSDFLAYTRNHPFEFRFTARQYSILTSAGRALSTEYKTDIDVHMDSVVKRGGRSIFKIGMILSCFRRYSEKNVSTEYFCNDVDFETALSMITTLIPHSQFVADLLKKDKKLTVSKVTDKKLQILKAVPECFSRKEALSIVEEQGIGVKARTIDNYLRELSEEGVLVHASHDRYCKKSA